MGSLRPQNQKYNQTIDGSAPSPKFGLDPTQLIDPATKHTASAWGWSAGRGPQREVLLVSQAASLLLLRAHGCFVCVVFGVYTSVGVGVNGCLSGFSGWFEGFLILI